MSGEVEPDRHALIVRALLGGELLMVVLVLLPASSPAAASAPSKATMLITLAVVLLQIVTIACSRETSPHGDGDGGGHDR